MLHLDSNKLLPESWCASISPHAYTTGLWLNIGMHFSLLPQPPTNTNTISLHAICLEKKAHKNTTPSSPPNSRCFRMVEQYGVPSFRLVARNALCALQIICASDLCPLLPSTWALGVCGYQTSDLSLWSAQRRALRQKDLVASHNLFQMCGAICQ